MHHFHVDSNILLTGVTGLLGGEIFRRLVASGHRGKIWMLIREKNGETARDRLEHRLRRCNESLSDQTNLRPCGGDVTSPGWALDPHLHEEITSEVDFVIHNAADTSFVAHRETSRTNVDSVETLIELARRCRKNPLIAYMSTASNVGQASNCCLREDEGCRAENHHFNEYTHSKAVGEDLLQASGLPVLTLRPSIVLSAGLSDPGFARQILWCVPLMRAFEALPLNPTSRLDIVDAEFVARTTLQLLAKSDRKWNTYHLSAGESGSWNLRELGELVDQIYDRKTPFRLIPPSEWRLTHQREFIRTPMRKKIFRSLKFYLPFLNMDVVFSDERLRTELGNRLPALRPIAGYFSTLLRLIRTKTALAEAAMP